MRVKKRLANTESKRKEFMPQNRNAPAVKAKRLHWKEHMPNLPIDHLVFLDESGINLRMIRRYGRAIGGKRVVDHAPLTRPRGTTLLSAIQVNKVIAQTRYPGGTTRSKFQQVCAGNFTSRTESGRYCSDGQPGCSGRSTGTLFAAL